MESSRAVFIWYAEQLTAHQHSRAGAVSEYTAAREEAVETFLLNMQAGASPSAVFGCVEKFRGTKSLYPEARISSGQDFAEAIFETLIPLTEASIRRPTDIDPEAFSKLSPLEKLRYQDNTLDPKIIVGLLRMARHVTLGNFPAEGNVYDHCGIIRDTWEKYFDRAIIKRGVDEVERERIKQKIIRTWNRLIEDGLATTDNLVARNAHVGVYTQEQMKQILRDEGLIEKAKQTVANASNDTSKRVDSKPGEKKPKRPAQVKKIAASAPALRPEGSIAA